MYHRQYVAQVSGNRTVIRRGVFEQDKLTGSGGSWVPTDCTPSSSGCKNEELHSIAKVPNLLPWVFTAGHQVLLAIPAASRIA
jgi:hypothetical protein